MKNLIIITLDGLRRDRLHLCKNLMSIARKNLFFENMFTAAPYTCASLHSFFSGTYPLTNGVNGYYNMFKFKKRYKTLFSIFKEKGYNVFANVLDSYLQPLGGVDEHFVCKQSKNIAKKHKELIFKNLDKEPFFIYLHYSYIHNMIVKNVAKKFSDFDDKYFNNYNENKKKYNSYVEKCDLYIKDIFDFLKMFNLLKNTIVIIWSDHGTSNGEKKGEKMYGSFVYDYTIKNFCIFVTKKKKKITYQCSSIDIFPTILELFDIKNGKTQGESLLKIKEDRFVFSETGGLFGYYPSPKKHNVFCFRFNNKKIIYNSTSGKWEFYDLTKDSNEEINLINKKTQEILEYKKILKKKNHLYNRGTMNKREKEIIQDIKK